MKIFALVSAVLLAFGGVAQACNTAVSYGSCYNQISYAVPVTVVQNYSTTDYAEVPCVQVQKLETLTVPQPVVTTYAPVALNSYSASYYAAPRRVVNERLVEVPRRQVNRQVVVEKNVTVVEKNVKVVRVNRNVQRNRNVNVNVNSY